MRFSGSGMPTRRSSSIARSRAARRRSRLEGSQLAPEGGRAADASLPIEDGIDHLLLDGEDRIQSGHRVLKDDANVLGADFAQFVAALARACFRRER